MVLLIFGCESKENVFEDYDTQNVYFPIQYPVRTISLVEDSRVDNSIDLEKAFSIGVSVGGIRSNEVNRNVNITLAPELVQNATINGNPVMMMPENYYSLSSSTQVTIPKGSFDGTIRVNLTDGFFKDPIATIANYVIPLKIVPSENYNVLTGIPSVKNPDRRIASDWETGNLPRDYTLFAVKYINKYHGVYLHKGSDETLDAPDGNVVSIDVYNAQYMEKNFLTNIDTRGLSESDVNRMGLNSGDNFKMNLKFNEDGSIAISSVDGGLPASGTGRFVTKADSDAGIWGNESHKTIFLNYKYQNNGVYHRCKDTLVFRNDDLKFEEFEIGVIP